MDDLPSTDSAALHSHGAVLRAGAEDLGRIADRVGHRVDTMEFHGPAADRFRAQMGERTVRLRRIAHELRDVAQIVAQAQSHHGT
ncbi:MAG TPA: hypothetical protein VNT03_00420 [Baekduia sp.]|nr:hypothetical protein [Baekduia sp.]